MDKTPDRDTVAELMKSFDLCMMATLSAGSGGVDSRPMSNNRQVDFDGDNWFFSKGDTRKVRDLQADPRCVLDFQDKSNWMSLQGEAVLHRDDRALFEKHWTKDIAEWFPDGIETPGLTLIQVTARRAELWGRHGNGVVEM